MAAAPLLLLSGWWYVGALPEPVREFFLRRSSEITAYRAAWPALLLAVAAGSLALSMRLPLGLRRVLAGLLLLAGLGLVLGAWLGVARFSGRGAVLAVLNTLLAVPSVVVGLAVYLLLSRSGPLGGLNSPLIPQLFTPGAMIVATAVVFWGLKCSN